MLKDKIKDQAFTTVELVSTKLPQVWRANPSVAHPTVSYSCEDLCLSFARCFDSTTSMSTSSMCVPVDRCAQKGKEETKCLDSCAFNLNLPRPNFPSLAAKIFCRFSMEMSELLDGPGIP
jgi:hypothetical protein